jgi:hypothetical protein
MKNLPVFFAICCLSFVTVLGQTRDRYVFDNFDTRAGVQIVAPPAAAVVPPTNSSQTSKSSSPQKKLVKKTSRATANAGDGLGLKNPPVGRMMMAPGVGGLNGFTTGDALIDSYIVESSLRYRIDPLLIYAQMHQESAFKRKAISYKGASGLMQLMPATARRFGVTEIFNPKQNIDAGVRYMRWLLDTFNQDLHLALAGYNAGEGAVMKYGWQIPPYSETREYVRRITGRYESIRNPNLIARTAKKVTATEAAKLERKEAAPAPLTVYEPSPLAVRLPDGRMRLVSQ